MRSSTRSTRPASRSTGARWWSARRRASSACTSTTWPRTSTGQALHAGAFELYLQDGARCRLAQVQDWGSGRGVRRLHALRRRRPRRATATGCRRCSAGTSCASTSSSRCRSRAATWPSAACSSPRSTSTWTCSPSTCTRPGPSGGDVHWRGAATGESRASFEGLIQIDPGAQQTHTYLQIHSMMLSPKARIDAIPSVLVSSDDVSASHGGTVGELDETAIFYMQTRGLDRPAAVRVIVEGFFEPLIASSRTSRWRSSCARRSPTSWPRRARTSRPMPPVAESSDERLRGSGRRAGRLPDLRPRASAAGALIYLDSGATSQKPQVGDRRAGRAPAQPQRERPPRRLRAGAGGRRGLREARGSGRGVHRRRAADDDLHQERDGGDQPRRLLVGPREHRPGRRGADHADGAPRQPRALAGALPRARRRAALPGGRRARRAVAAGARSRSSRAATCAGRLRARLERARHDQPGRRDDRADPRGGRACRWSTARRRCRRCQSTCARSAPTSTPGRATRRSGRRASACCTAARELLERDGAVPDGRRHDRLGRLPVGRPGTSCRTSSRRARRRSPRRSGSAAAVDYLAGARHGARARARARADRVHAGAARARCPGCASSGRPRPSAAAAWRRSRSRACTRTTSPSWPTARACASAPATTARSR